MGKEKGPEIQRSLYLNFVHTYICASHLFGSNRSLAPEIKKILFHVILAIQIWTISN